MAYQPKSYKKFVATAATATLVATAVVPAAFADEVETAAFTDVAKQYEEAVNFVVSNNISSGLTATTFGVSAQIKRGDAAIMIASAAGLMNEDAPKSGFSDVPTRGVLAINSLKAAGVVNGKSATNFGFNDSITRGEAAIMLANAFDLKGDVKNVKFTDVNDRYLAAVAALVEEGVTNGISATQFGTTNNIKRGDFARFVYALEEYINPVNPAAPVLNYNGSTTINVAYGAGLTLPTVTATDDEDTNVQVNREITDAAGNVISSIDTKVAGTYKVTYSATDSDGNKAKNLVITVVVAPSVDTVVSTASVVNANEVLVKTSGKLSETSANDESNYKIFVNNSTTATPVVDAQLQEDGTSVLLRFGTALTNGQTVKVETEDTLLDSNYNKVAAFEGTPVIFQDQQAPKLLSVEYNGTNVVATFDEPVSSVANVRINGVQATFGSAVKATEAGNYEYVLVSAPTANGTHNVVLTDAKDANGNTSATQSTSYTVVADATAPAVSSVEATGTNTFKVNFTKPLAAASSVNNLVVKKGANTIDNSRITPVLSTDRKSITFTVNAEDTQLPLFGTNENTVALNVSFDGYKDANGLLGAPYSGTVTLTKDTTAPVILSKNLVKLDSTKKVVTITYNEKVDAVTAKNTAIVVKKDGIVQTSMTPTVADVAADTDERTVTLTFASALVDGDYTFELPTGLVKDKSGNESAADTIAVEVSTASEYFVPTVANPTTNSNQITVTTTGTDFTDSATVLANYKLDDASLPTGTTINFVDNKKKVVITLPTSFPVVADADYKLEISKDVKNADGSSVAGSAGTTFTQLVTLQDNVAPTLQKVEINKDAVQTTQFNTLTLTFSENLAAVSNNAATIADFKVLVNGNAVAVNSVIDGTVGDKVVTLTTGALYDASQTVTVTVVPVGTDNAVVDVTDIGLNKLQTGTTVTGVIGTTAPQQK